MRAYLKVRVSPGVFSCEKFVSFKVGKKNHNLIVDTHSVSKDKLEVRMISFFENEALIELPRETFTHGTRIHVPISMLME